MSPRRSALRRATWEEIAHYGKTLPKGLLPPMAGGASPPVPTLDASQGSSALGTAVTSINKPFNTNVPVGELVVTTGSTAATAEASQSFSDTQANPYTPSGSLSDATNNIALAMGASTLATAVVATTDHITYTVGTAANIKCAGASFLGCASNADTAAYSVATNSGNSATASVTSGVVQANDLAVVWITSNTAAAVALPAGWTNINTAIASAPSIRLAYLVPTTTGTLSISSAVTSGVWGIVVVAFPAPDPSFAPTRMPLGA